MRYHLPHLETVYQRFASQTEQPAEQCLKVFTIPSVELAVAIPQFLATTHQHENVR